MVTTQVASHAPLKHTQDGEVGLNTLYALKNSESGGNYELSKQATYRML